MAETTTAPTARGRAYAEAFLGVPFRPQTYLNLCYLLLAFPLGLAYVVFVTVGVSLGVGLAVVLVGIPILALTAVAALALGTLERSLAAYFLDADVESRPFPDESSWRTRAKLLATDVGTWKTLVYLPSKLAFGVLALALSTSLLSTGLSLLLVPLYYDEPGLYVGLMTDRPVELHPTLYVAWNQLLVGFEAVWTLDAWRVTTLGDALVVALAGVLILLLALHALNALARVARWYTKLMLGGAYDALDVVR